MNPLVTSDPSSPIHVNRWSTERPLLYLNMIAAIGLWVLFLAAASQMFGWAVFLVAVFALMHVALVAHVRGSAVRLGPDQFPELYSTVERLSARMGLRRTPEVYLMQQDGALNAFATRFLRAHMVVLFADLLAACGSNTAARDMIIGHELGHIRAGHLRGPWLLMPAAFIPFLGAALSRAREYTCDRYGLAAAGDLDGALLGLTILAAGGRFAPEVNRDAFLRQRHDMRSGLMLLGEWLGSHPPLSRRLAALQPRPLDAPAPIVAGSLRPLLAIALVLAVGVVTISLWAPSLKSSGGDYPAAKPGATRADVETDFDRIAALIEDDRRGGKPLPWDLTELYQRWSETRPAGTEPLDPFSGYWYDYDRSGTDYRLVSAGPDGEFRTKDDIVHDSRTAGRRQQ